MMVTQTGGFCVRSSQKVLGLLLLNAVINPHEHHDAKLTNTLLICNPNRSAKWFSETQEPKKI